MSGDTFTLQGGLQRVCVKLVDKIGSQNVLLNQPVSSVVSVEANKVLYRSVPFEGISIHLFRLR